MNTTLPAMRQTALMARPAQQERGFTLRAFLIGVGMLIIANIWMKYAALITLSSQVTMSVPPIPALTALILLLALRSASRFLGVSRREMLFIYVFLTLSVALTSGGALREFMPEMTVLQYFATPENGWAEFVDHQPAWLCPKDQHVIQGYYEGGWVGVPWSHWLIPLGAWSTLFLLLLGTLLCAAMLFYDEWSERERLTFPLTEIPLSMTAPKEAGRKIPQLWRDPIMWAGFMIAVVHNGLNIVHAFNPGVPALGLSYSLGGLFTEHPWTAFSDLEFHYRPEIWGLGYLMPQDVIISSLAFYALLKLESFGAIALGYNASQFPHQWSQAAGAFVIFGIFLIVIAWKRLKDAFYKTLTGETAKQGEAWACWGLLLGILGMWIWCRAAGMSTLTFVLFFGVLLMMALTYCRIRSETGLPLQWCFPVSRANMMLTSIFGSDFFLAHGGIGNLTIYYTQWFLTRGYLPNLSAYHFESLRIGQESGISRREIVIALLLAMLLGIAVSFYVQLGAYYTEGANFLEGGTHGGGMRVGDARYGFTLLQEASRGGIPRNPGETGAIIWGAVVTIAITMVRAHVPRFPLHHLGFIIGTTRGYRAWGGLLAAAIVKTIAVRLGGVKLYRRLIPAAIGVVLGHFLIAGGVWSIIALFGGEAFRSYQVWFG